MNSQRRRHRGAIQYPPALATPFPKFAQWLNSHVLDLREEGYPVSKELLSLHCPPSQYAWTFNGMWAYGCHYSVSQESGPSAVAFDCGIASIPPSQTSTEIDVGILRNIILVTYLGLNCVVMEGSWIKTRDQGRRVIKKDPHGFWLVHYASRDAPAKHNPYVYPASVSQVFFISDSIDPAWKVVLRHDPRSKRVEGDRIVQVFGAAGSARPTLSTRTDTTQDRVDSPSSSSSRPVEEVPPEQFNAYVMEEERPEDETHLDDTQYEDEVELMYVE